MAKPQEMARYWDEDPDRCWCCGREDEVLERAHIIPRMDGGLDHPANLLLLCPGCHKWQEAVTRQIIVETGLYGLRDLVRRGHLLPIIREAQRMARVRTARLLYARNQTS